MYTASPMPDLVESRTLKVSSSPSKSVTIASEAYILSLASIHAYYAASESSPSNHINLLDKASLRYVQALPGHEIATTYVRSVDNIAQLARQSIVSSGKDGTVKIWDERSNSVSINLTTPGSSLPLLCCDVSSDGLTLAGGSVLQGDDASILYWDPRSPGVPLRIHSSTHSDDVTAVHFLKTTLAGSSHNIILSVSSDGLICTSNADERDEEEAVMHVGNWGCSVAQAGWIYDHPGPKIWASSDMETFSTWSSELDLVKSLDIRTPSVHTQERTWVTDYLIGCHSCRSSNDALNVFVGSNEGDIALISNTPRSDAWALHRLCTTGHVGVVRSALWDQPNNVLITGGEDSKVNAWPFPPLESETSTLPSLAGDVDVAMEVETTCTTRKRDWESEDARQAPPEHGSKRSKHI